MQFKFEIEQKVKNENDVCKPAVCREILFLQVQHTSRLQRRPFMKTIYVTVDFECIIISGVESFVFKKGYIYIYIYTYTYILHTISPPLITFQISNTLHFNTLFQNGVIRGLLLAFKYMGQNNNKKGGVVVNIASISGLVPCELVPIYGGIKHGVVGLTKSFGVGRL